MEQNTLTKKLITWSAIATILAGVIHLVIVPEHWEHAPAHGLFFLLVGILQIAWGVLVWRKPSTELYYVGVVMAGWLIILYILTRIFPAPFGHGPETVHAIDLVCKLCEALGMFTLAVLIFQGILLNASRKAAWRTMAWIVLLSFIIAGTTYSAAIAAEPVLPFLSGAAGEHNEHEEESAHPPEEEHDQEELSPTP